MRQAPGSGTATRSFLAVAKVANATAGAWTGGPLSLTLSPAQTRGEGNPAGH